jgi:hypothetical protein
LPVLQMGCEQVPPLLEELELLEEPPPFMLRYVLMKPPGPVCEITRMSTPQGLSLIAGGCGVPVVGLMQFELPYDVVPTTTCIACGAPAGISAGPPLSPSHGPEMLALGFEVVLPSVYWK